MTTDASPASPSNEFLDSLRLGSFEVEETHQKKRVSSVSFFEDLQWYLDDANGSCINWDVELLDGSRFSSPQHAVLLTACRKFVWSRMKDPREGNVIKPSSAVLESIQVKQLASWMVTKNHYDFSTLDADAFDEYAEYCVAEVENFDVDIDNEDEDLDIESGAEENEDDGVVWRHLFRRFSIWARIWGQRSALALAQVKPPSSDPLQGRSAHKLASDIATFVMRRIPPLPDEVAIPIMNEAHRWIGVRADDVIRLHKFYMDTIQGWRIPGKPILSGSIQKWHADQLGTFHFSVEPGSDKPWHPPIRAEVQEDLSKHKDGPRLKYTFPTQEVRDLVDKVRGGSILVIHGETGMRIGEVAKLPAGENSSTGSHNAIEVRRSKTGLNEHFYLLSALEKHAEAPRRDEWLSGSRPVGSEYVPGPFRAVHVLEKLLAPWRERSSNPKATAALIVNTANGAGLPRDDIRINSTSRKSLQKMLQKWIEQCVDLSNLPDKSKLDEDLTRYRKTKGRCIKTHQWRKSFAMYVVRTDRRMIPAVSTHFKHMSVAITEQAYISNNPDLLRDRDSQQARAAAAFMYQAVTGKAPVAGRIAKLIEEHAAMLSEVIGRRHGVGAIDKLEDWCASLRIRVFSSPHGKCFIGLKPVEAKCHEIGGTAHWSNSKPNFKTREPDVCAGCGCFGVDIDHAEFWVNRYLENQTAWQQAKSRGLSAGFRVIQERAAQSANMLNALKIELPNIEGSENAKKTT